MKNMTETLRKKRKGNEAKGKQVSRGQAYLYS